jgi:hypothetical protein
MRSHLRTFVGSVLLASLCSFSAQGQEKPSTWRVFDIGFTPGVGYFLYPQYVDRGYSINGRPYDLVWSGLQLQLSTAAHFYFPRAQHFGMGVAAAFIIAPKPKGADRDDTVSVDPGQSALGGYLALSLAFRRAERWRLTVETGLGRAGISGALGFGGWGLACGAAAHGLFGAGELAAGIGLRLNLMVISTEHEGTVRGESGLYASFLLEVPLVVSRRAVLIAEEPPAADDSQSGEAAPAEGL